MRRFLFALLLCLLATAAACSAMAEPLEVTVLKVGKADAILIQHQGHAMLIDAAEAEDADKVLELLEDKQVTTLDYLLITHLDKDHLGGAADVLNAVSVRTVYQCASISGSDNYIRYQTACSRKGIEPVALREPVSIPLGGAKINLLPAAQTVYPDDNSYSVMAELFYGKTSFLFAGDAVGERLLEFLQEEHEPYTFLKVPHHGRWDDLCKDFFQAVKPRYAVVTCSKKNMPDPDVLKLLDDLNVSTFLTLDGTVTVTSDGSKLMVEQ